ncbi:acyl-coenzyme A diphosphatase NUDT19-like [Littorina saxatilis]|uniref:Nudix hydrolase domain-containing protein n=1 Tax=Littorina saxatilis TaxID=31220 RepID=A0AAN9C621_9CAEN
MCAAVLKNWREAATLMLVHGRKKIQNRILDNLHPSQALQQTTNLADHGLELLVLKRSMKSSFMPNKYVFPGGIADDSDFSLHWLPIFGATTPELAAHRFGFAKTVEEITPMFYRLRPEQFSVIPSEIAFRICAIRETFEEAGVLLVRSVDQSSYDFNASAAYPYHFGEDHSSKVEEWRHKVVQNPLAFLTLCENLEVVPDVWSLYNWSNWLTPHFDTVIDKEKGKRYDTAFFITCVGEKPYVAEDAKEAVHSEWVSPLQMIEDFAENRVQLAPPQLYEASRLVNCNTVDALLGYLQRQARQPVERWMPVMIKCADGVIFTFPGDSLYPKKPDLEGEHPTLKREEKLQELKSQSSQLHRAIIQTPPVKDGKPTGNKRIQLECTIDLPYGHVAPSFEG